MYFYTRSCQKISRRVLSWDSDFIVTSKCRNLGNFVKCVVASQGNTGSNLHYQLTGFLQCERECELAKTRVIQKATKTRWKHLSPLET